MLEFNYHLVVLDCVEGGAKVNEKYMSVVTRGCESAVKKSAEDRPLLHPYPSVACRQTVGPRTVATGGRMIFSTSFSKTLYDNRGGGNRLAMIEFKRSSPLLIFK